MQNFNKTLTILNTLISKLEANTGGEKLDVKLESVTVPIKQQSKKQTKNKSTKPEKKIQEKVEEKKEPQEKKQKKEKKKEEKKAQVKEEEKKDGEMGVETFSQIDIRIGEMVECWKHPESEKLYCERINIGTQVRQIASGLQGLVPFEDMRGLVIVMANLKPRPLAKFMSNGMVVCAEDKEGTKASILRPDGNIGERVYLQGHEELFKNEQILPVLNPKRKILEKTIDFFKTDEEGFVVWKGIRLKTSGGYLKSEIKQGSVR